MKIRPVGAVFFPYGWTDGLMDRRTDTWRSYLSPFAILRMRLKTISQVNVAEFFFRSRQPLNLETFSSLMESKGLIAVFTAHWLLSSAKESVRVGDRVLRGQFQNRVLRGQFQNRALRGQFRNRVLRGQFQNHVLREQFQNQSRIGWLKKYKIENKTLFYGTLTYIHNCITSPHSCHPHLDTCPTVTLVFVVPRQRTVPPSCAASCWLHPWALRCCWNAGSQPDLHLGEEMVIAWRQVQGGWSKISQLKSLIEAFVRAAVWDRPLSCRRTTLLVSIPRRLFWINLRSLFSISLITLSPYTWHNRRWISAGFCPCAWSEENESQHVPYSWRERR
jgi:hypothetical protein